MRNDIHSPKQIIPSDYQYVAVWTMNIQGLGDCEFIKREREIVKAHMERTKGEYAHVETSGSCQICGNVLAIYLALFYHEKSNSYIRVGMDCSAKLDMSGDEKAFNLFRKNVQSAREAQAGKRKAIAVLGDAGLSEAWDIYSAEFPGHIEGCAAAGQNVHGDDNGVDHECTCEREVRIRQWDAWEERTIRDIIGKLVKYGNISEKQTGFIGNLLNKIQQRPIIEAQRKAEADAAGPVPTGRVKMAGVVVSIKTVERDARYYGDSGLDTKVLIKLDNGSKVYGNRFANVDRNDKVEFVATVTASKDDPKFGFFKRAILQSDLDITKRLNKERAEVKKLMKVVAWA